MNGFNFTERTRTVLALSREEAVRLGHEYVGTEHILLGLIREGGGVANAMLLQLGADPQGLVKTLEGVIRRGTAPPDPTLPYTSRAKKVLELAMNESRELGHPYVGCEHLLMGLLREEKGIAAQVLKEAGVSVPEARAEMLRILGADETQVPAARIPPPDGPREPPFNLTERIRRILGEAQEEAVRMRHEYIGTEHLLLPLLRERDGVAAAVLENLRIDTALVEARLRETVKKGPSGTLTMPQLPWTSRAKKVLEIARREAAGMNHSYIGTEHVLLGLLGEERGIAAQVLKEAGLDLEAARRETLRLLGNDVPDGGTPAQPWSVPSDQRPAGSGLRVAAIDVRVMWEDGHSYNRHFRSVKDAMAFLESVGDAEPR